MNQAIAYLIKCLPCKQEDHVKNPGALGTHVQSWPEGSRDGWSLGGLWLASLWKSVSPKLVETLSQKTKWIVTEVSLTVATCTPHICVHICSGCLNKNDPYRLICLSIWFLVDGIDWERLGYMALLEEVCHWRGFWGFRSLLHSQLVLSASSLWIKI